MVKVSHECITAISQEAPIADIKRVCLVPSAFKPRKRSAYQEHMSVCVKSKKGPVTERFKACIDEWRRKKGK